MSPRTCTRSCSARSPATGRRASSGKSSCTPPRQCAESRTVCVTHAWLPTARTAFCACGAGAREVETSGLTDVSGLARVMLLGKWSPSRDFGLRARRSGAIAACSDGPLSKPLDMVLELSPRSRGAQSKLAPSDHKCCSRSASSASANKKAAPTWPHRACGRSRRSIASSMSPRRPLAAERGVA